VSAVEALAVALTGLHVADPPQFVAAAAALIVTLIGFGLLLGLLVSNAGALNTYAGFLVAPVLAAPARFSRSTPGSSGRCSTRPSARR
jgi:hypothetical protein